MSASQVHKSHFRKICRYTKAQTPLLRFVMDMLYNKFYNKSTINRNNVVWAYIAFTVVNC